MNYQGYSTDNIHIGETFIKNPNGDLTIEKNLTVEGGVDLSGDVVINPPNCLQTDCINTSVPASQGIVINNNYELTGQGGNVGDVLALVSGTPNKAVFQPLTAGTARVTINKYAGNTTNTRSQVENGVYEDIEINGFGSKSYTDDEFAEGSVINIKANGNWTYLRSSQAFIPEGRFRVVFGSVTVELFAPFPEKPFAGTYPQLVSNSGNWELILTLTRTSPTAFRIGGVLQNSLSEAQNSVEIPISKPQQLDLLPNILSVPTFPATINVQWQDLSNQGGGNAYLYPALCQYSQDLSSSGTSVVATSENLTTDHLLLSNLNGNGGDGGHVFLYDLRGLKPMTGNMNMNNNSITNLQNIDVGGGTLNINNTGFPAMNITGGVNFNNTGFIYQCPSLFAGSGNLDIGSDFGVVNIQTGPFGSRQTEIAIIPNLLNVFSPITNFVGGDVYLSQNRIQDVSMIDDGANNSINMKDAGLGNAISIKSVGAGVDIKEQSTGNRIGVNTTGLSSQVLSGGTIISNSDVANNLTLSKTNGGQIFLQNTGAGGAITGEAEQIDFNYTTTNFKVRNGLTTNFIIEPTKVESLLNFVCPTINGLTASSGVFMGTSNSLFYNPSVDGAIEKSILPVSIVGSFSVPANTFKISSYHLVLAGPFNSNNGDTLTIRLYGGPTSATILGILVVPLNNSSTSHFEIECDFAVQALGGPGVAKINTNFDFTYNQSGGGGAFVGERNTGTNNITFDTTVNNTLLVTAQFSSTNVANNMLTTLSKLTQTY